MYKEAKSDFNKIKSKFKLKKKYKEDKIRTTAASYLSKKRTSEPMLGEVYNMVKEVEIDLYNEVKKKLMR